MAEHYEHGSFAIYGQDNAIYIYKIFQNYTPEITSHKLEINKVSKDWYDLPSPLTLLNPTVSVTNAMSLSSKLTFLCPVLWDWSWTRKCFSFSSWHDIKFCQYKVLKGHTAVESGFFSWFWCAFSF